jgi:hypothetical protein
MVEEKCEVAGYYIKARPEDCEAIREAEKALRGESLSCTKAMRAINFLAIRTGLRAKYPLLDEYYQSLDEAVAKAIVEGRCNDLNDYDED